jgi:hypothetical protein
LAAVVTLLSTVLFLVFVGSAQAESTAAVLGTADSFAVLGGQSVTNTGPSVVTGDLGVSPGSSVTGFPPGTVVAGTIHAADALAAQAQAATTTAYNNLAGRAPTANLTGQDLGGLTLVPGVYRFSSTAQLTGTLTLNAQGDPNAVFIFQIGSALTTASNSRVALINGARACQVYWQVGSSATLGTNTDFLGSVVALTSIAANTGADVEGRLLARNGSTTLDNNRITRASCEDITTPPTTPPTTTPSGDDDDDDNGGGGDNGSGDNGSGDNGSGDNGGDNGGDKDSGDKDSGDKDSGDKGGQVTQIPVGSVDTGDGSTVSA